MPKRIDLESIFVGGAGPIAIVSGRVTHSDRVRSRDLE